MNTTLVNATPVPVKYRDGKEETIELRQLTIRQLYKFAELATTDSSPEMVALCCGKPADWIDQIDDDSYGLLLKRVHELNFQRAVQLVTKDPLVAAKLLPLLLRMQEVEKLLPTLGITSPAPSPVPASSASVEATGSAAST
jgi:hypothetical protein